MKKIILLVLILVSTSFFVVSIDNVPLNFEKGRHSLVDSKNENWEYVKDKLFDGKSSEVFKINGPILIKLRNATHEDSLLVKESMQEIREILPNKEIDFYKNFTGKSKYEIQRMHLKPSDSLWGYKYSELLQPTINFGFYSSEDYGTSLDSRYFALSQGSSILRSLGIGKGNFGPADIKFRLKKGVFSRQYKKEQIRYQLMLSLCVIQSENNESSEIEYGSIWRSKGKIMIKDKFLLQKLYSDDFLKQFEVYLYANYPWRYANLFLDKDFVKTKIFVLVLISGLLIFVLIFNVFNKRTYKFSWFNYAFPLLVISISFINLIYIYTYFAGETNWVNWSMCMCFMIPVTFIISFLLWLLEKKVISEQGDFIYQLILKLIFTFIVLNIPAFLFISIPYGLLTTYLPVFVFTIILTFGRGLLIYLNHFSDSIIKQKDIELSRLKALHAKAELKSLQSQINPHFLYNSLNSIASLAPIDSKRTQEMAHSLSDLFKYSINRKGKKMSTIKDEINMVNTYLSIEKIRFGDRLKFVVEVDKAIENHEIPLFLIQPLIENAVKHGISKQAGNGEILLKIKEEKNELVITVSDSGPNFPKGLVSGHGLQTVYDLLRLSYGDKASLNWTNVPEKTITITMPKKQ